MTRVLLLSRYGTLGASSRVRMFQYESALREAGIELTVSPFFPDSYLRALYSGRRDLRAVLTAFSRRFLASLRARRYDVIWLEKEAFPWLPVLAERLLFATGVPVVADYDDAIFHNYDTHPNAIVRRTLGGKIDWIMRRSHTVMVGNEYLASRALAAGAARVELVPTVVDLSKYQLKASVVNKPLVIGWIGSPATEHFLQIVAGPIEEACARFDCRFVAIGAAALPFQGRWAATAPWSEQSEANQVGEIDIGIMPLSDSPWERGKCGYKLIQYMACGKPVIASPVGVNRTIVIDGDSGFLANSDGDWRRALTALLSNDELRRRMGHVGRERVEQDFSLQALAPRVTDILLAAGGA